jgi:hypothetical protein
MVERLVFVESGGRARDYRNQPPEVGTRLVAITAEALQSFEHAGVACTPISQYTTTRSVMVKEDEKTNLAVFSLAEQLDARLSKVGFRWDGPGPFVCQSYYLHFSLITVLNRCILMREAIGCEHPRHVAIEENGIDPWFDGDGGAHNPWTEVVKSWQSEMGFELEILDLPVRKTAVPVKTALTIFLERLFFFFRGKLRALMNKKSAKSPLSLRLLMVGSTDYDWKALVELFPAHRGGANYLLPLSRPDNKRWMTKLGPVLKSFRGGLGIKLVSEGFHIDTHETVLVNAAMDAWRKQEGAHAHLTVEGIDYFPALWPHWKNVGATSLALLRYTDGVTDAALKAARPDIVCFFAVADLASKRLAFRCDQHGIPTVCFQHAFGYGVQIQAADEQIETQYADYFLTYGSGIVPREKPAFPVKSRYVPIGSTRIEKMRDRLGENPRPLGGRPIQLLWVAEISTRNTNGRSVREDTARYSFQKKGLGLLAQVSEIRTLFRPYRTQLAWDGTVSWLRKARIPVRIEAVKPLEDLIHESDVVVMEASSPTAWAEVFALNRPMILFSDPVHNPLVPSFSRELENVCCWCKNEKELFAALQGLTSNGWNWIKDLRSLKTQDFVGRYILPIPGSPTARLVSFLQKLHADREVFRRKNKEWEVEGAG